MTRLCFILLAISFALPAQARDYGQHGTHFKIIETDLLEQIANRLSSMQKNGDIERLNRNLKARTIARVNRPAPVAGLVSATDARSRLFDPSITIQADIRGADGRIIWPKGTRVNPLDTVPLRAPLIFLDGDDVRQLAWALGFKSRHPAKLILTNGAPLDIMKARQRRFFFDQGGKLVQHFGIRVLPSVIDQQGQSLRIREVALTGHGGEAH